jgi:STE24 endopeptidase
VLVGAALLVALLAAWLVPWSWVPGGRLVPVPASSLFTAAEVHRMETYSWWQRSLGWASSLASLALLMTVAFSRRGRAVVRRLVVGRRWWLAVLLAVVGVLLLERLVTLPFGIASHEVSLRYGTSRQGWLGWGGDVLRSLLVSAALTSGLLLVLVGVARRSPRWWFAWAGGAAVLLTFAGSFLYPVVVEPVFNRFTPMAAGPFKESVLKLADREGVRVDDVLVADASRRTTTLNAYVSGFGSTRRVVVYDNLVDQLSAAEARVVVAHELGHARYGDVLLGTTLGSVATVGGVALLALLLDGRRLRARAGVQGAADPAVVVVVLVLVAIGGLAASPVQNTVSRAIEARADRASLQATGAGTTFVRMQRRLALTSLADPTPPRLNQLWFGSHPTVLQRAGLPRALARAEQ